MGSFEDLPAEILLAIYKPLNTKDLVECQLICKKLKTFARKLLYRHVSFSSDAQLNSLTNALVSNPLLGDLVETLAIMGSLPPSTLFGFFVNACPNLKSINQGPTMHPSEEFRETLLYQLQQGNWKQMISIEPPVYSQDLELYAKTAWEIRDRLSTLCIYFSRIELVTGVQKASHKQIYQFLADRIEFFVKLDTLKFAVCERLSISDFDIYINKCSSLRNLAITTRFQPPAATQNGEIMQNDAIMQSDAVNPKPLVKTLYLSIVIFNDDTLVYLMRKFPALSKLTFDCYPAETKYNEILSADLSMNITSLFLSYVLNIPDLYIRKLYLNNACQLIAQNYPKSTYLDKNVSLTVIYDSNNPHLNIVKDTSGINDAFSIEIYHKAHKSVPELSHLFLLEEIGYTLKRLDLSMKITMYYLEESWWIEDGFITDMTRGYYLDHIIQHCPHLQHLRLESTVLFHCNKSFTNTIWNIKHLHLDKCLVRTEIFTKISSQVPTLDLLHLERCQFVADDAGGTELESSSVLINMPNTAIRTLKWGTENCKKRLAFTVFNTITGTKEFYFGANGERISGQSAELYSTFVENEPVFTIDIRCAAGIASIE